MALDHTTYLERHHELTDKALTDVALMLAHGDVEDATALVTTTRQQTDALWAERTEGLGQT